MRHRATGASRGFGFVTVNNDDLANQLCSGETKIELDGRTLEFKPAVSKEDMASGTSLTPAIPLKIFVAGVSYNTTEEIFQKYFSQFGETESAGLMKDRKTGLSRGFGYVTFLNKASVEKTLSPNQLELDGRRLDIKPAIAKADMERTAGPGGFGLGGFGPGGFGPGGFGPGGFGPGGFGLGGFGMGYGMPQGLPQGYGRAPRGGLNTRSGAGRGGGYQPARRTPVRASATRAAASSDNKVFVAGLAQTTQTAGLRAYFQQFGNLIEAIVKTDIKSGASLGFGFVVFETAAGAERALAQAQHVIDNKNVDIKIAVPKHIMEEQNRNRGSTQPLSYQSPYDESTYALNSSYGSRYGQQDPYAAQASYSNTYGQLAQYSNSQFEGAYPRDSYSAQAAYGQGSYFDSAPAAENAYNRFASTQYDGRDASTYRDGVYSVSGRGERGARAYHPYRGASKEY